jgi:fatty-acyl-CoA synthase
MITGNYLARRALYSPDKLAIVDHGKTPAWRLTYAQMNARADRLANWLRADGGVGYRDRVAVLARDGVEHLDLFFACGKLGAIHTTLNWRLHWRETRQLLENTSPKLLFYGPDFAEAAAQLEGVTNLVPLEGLEAIIENASPEPVSYEALEPEDIAALIFTGGTTGLPKAAQVSHRQIAWNTLNTVIHDLYHDDVYLNVFPLFHTGGLFVYTLPNVIMGSTTVLVRQFDPEQVLDLIEREDVTVFAGVPTMYQLLTQAPNWEQADLSGLRFCTSGGAPLPVPLVEQYTREKGVRFKQGFGMTEFGPGVFALAPEDAVRKAGSIGRPNFFVEAGIMDSDGRLLGPDEVGELVLKGPSATSGYFGLTEEPGLDAPGFFHTGDLARYDAEGCFFIVDRVKDMFISGGENVYPAEIEKALYEHPAVHQCAVVGLPDEKWGQVGHACVILKSGAQAEAGELLAFLGERLARYKVPKGVTFMQSLPISGAGKILKTELVKKLTG